VTKIVFNIFEDFLKVCEGFKPRYDAKTQTYRGLPVKDCFNSVYISKTDCIHINLIAYRNDDILKAIPRSIQHEYIHIGIIGVDIRVPYSMRGEEWIVSLMLDYDYPLEVFDTN